MHTKTGYNLEVPRTTIGLISWIRMETFFKKIIMIMSYVVLFWMAAQLSAPWWIYMMLIISLLSEVIYSIWKR